MADSKPTKKKHYLDTCILLGYLNEEPNKFAECNAVISAAEQGIIEVCTSVLTSVELTKVRGFSLDSERVMDKYIDQFIFDSTWIQAIAFEREMGIIAKSLRRQYQLNLFDAIHLATAIRECVDFFDTTDKDFWNVGTSKGKMPKSITYMDADVDIAYEPIIIQRPMVDGYTMPIPFTQASESVEE